MAGVLIRGENRDTDTEGHLVMEAEAGGVASISQGMLRIAGEPADARRGKRGSFAEPLVGT